MREKDYFQAIKFISPWCLSFPAIVTDLQAAANAHLTDHTSREMKDHWMTRFNFIMYYTKSRPVKRYGVSYVMSISKDAKLITAIAFVLYHHHKIRV